MKKTITLKVEGMTCSHCSANVERTLNKVGIPAKVNLAKNVVTFTYDSDKTPLSYIARLIKQQGYKLVIDEKNKGFNYQLFALIFSIVTLVVAVLGMINMIIMDQGIHIDFFMFFDSNLIKLIFASLALVAIGTPFIYRSIVQIKMKRVGMDLLISLSSLASYILSVSLLIVEKDNLAEVFKMGTTTYFDSTMMILSIIYIGHMITDFVKNKSSSTLDKLQTLIPENANKINDDGSVSVVEADTLEYDDTIIVKQGEAIPTDSVVISGTGEVDEKVLSGESLPRHVKEGDEVFLSTTLISGTLTLKVVNPVADSMMSNIVNESYALDNKKGHLNRISDKIASFFVPAIILISIIAFVINYFAINQNLPENQRVTESIINAIAVLVVSCPCAFGLAVPLSSLNGFYLALKKGVLFKTGDTFEQVREIKTIYFDKTGTLTKGALGVDKCTLPDNILSVVKKVESISNHPIAKGICEYKKEILPDETVDISAIKEVPGIGLYYKEFKIGNIKLLDGVSVDHTNREILDSKDKGSIVVILKDDKLVGLIDLKDEILEDSHETISTLQKMGIRPVLISGDNKEYTNSIGQSLGFDSKDIYAEVLPNQKKEVIDKDINNDEKLRSHTCYIGDGVNDILALSATNLRVASYSASEITKAKANCILLKQKVSLIIDTIKISKKVFINIIENFIWAILYNLILIPFAIMGDISPTLASVLMIVSSLTLIVNASRIRLYKVDRNKGVGI